jgi:hypothetical protein
MPNIQQTPFMIEPLRSIFKDCMFGNPMFGGCLMELLNLPLAQIE